MCDSLQKQSIDIIVFSGDLVFEASNADILNNASDVLFTPLIKTLNLDNKRVIITPGNHDLKEVKKCLWFVINWIVFLQLRS